MHLRSLLKVVAAASATLLLGWPLRAATRQEHFDHEPPNWEGINNHNTNFPARTVTQDFGYNGGSRHIGERPGEVGGKINPAGEAAYYGYRLSKEIHLDKPMSTSGKILVLAGHGHFLLGFFRVDTLNEWRTPNTMVARINVRGEGFHCHLEYCSSRWRAQAGVIGEIVPGERVSAKLIACGRVYDWQLVYEPKGDGGNGLLTLTLGDRTATCKVGPEGRADGASFTHFGLLPVLKAWDNPGEVWLGEVTINGKHFDFATDPEWDHLNNRRTYITTNTRPRFDFGWSPTQFAGGKAAGELGGLIFRGDCREKHRLAAYGDKLSLLTLDAKLHARGRVAMTRGVSDSTASIGFYHSDLSLRDIPVQYQYILTDYIWTNCVIQ